MLGSSLYIFVNEMGNSLISSLRECALVELSDMSTVADTVFFESLGFDPSPFSKQSRALFIASVEFEAKRKKFDPDVILEKKNVIVAEVVAQAKELEKTLEEKMNLLDACHAVRKDLKTAHSSLQEQIIELERIGFAELSFISYGKAG